MTGTKSRDESVKQKRDLLAKGQASTFEEEARTCLFLAHKKMKEFNSGAASNPITYADLVPDDQLGSVMRVLGRRGGLMRAIRLSDKELTEIAYQGVDARRRKISAKRRSEIAAQAAKARWSKPR